MAARDACRGSVIDRDLGAAAGASRSRTRRNGAYGAGWAVMGAGRGGAVPAESPGAFGQPQLAMQVAVRQPRTPAAPPGDPASRPRACPGSPTAALGGRAAPAPPRVAPGE